MIQGRTAVGWKGILFPEIVWHPRIIPSTVSTPRASGLDTRSSASRRQMRVKKVRKVVGAPVWHHIE